MLRFTTVQKFRVGKTSASVVLKLEGFEGFESNSLSENRQTDRQLDRQMLLTCFNITKMN